MTLPYSQSSGPAGERCLEEKKPRIESIEDWTGSTEAAKQMQLLLASSQPRTALAKKQQGARAKRLPATRNESVTAAVVGTCGFPAAQFTAVVASANKDESRSHGKPLSDTLGLPCS
jgi:hypothetical protein